MSGDGNINRPLLSLLLLGIVDFCCILIGLEQINVGKIASGIIWISVGIGSALIGYNWQQIKAKIETRFSSIGDSRLYRIVIYALIVSGFLVGVGTVISLLYHKSTIAVETAPPTSTQPANAMEVPTVEVGYSTAMMPFFVWPNTCVYVLELNRKLTAWPEQICVSRDQKKLKIPPHYPEGNSVVPEDFAICKITNHSDKDLVNVRMAFTISFRSLKSITAIHTRKGKEESMTFPTRSGAKLGDGMTWMWYDPKIKKTFAFTEGDEILRQSRVVVLPSISAHDSGYIYIVNVSHHFTRFDLPTKIVAVVSGSPQEQVVKLIRPVTGIFDAFPYWGLTPDVYKWPGIPDDSQ
jgi:hypothetical protein